MVKYKYEFDAGEFKPGDCYVCPLSYWLETYGDFPSVKICTLNCTSEECPLEKVEE